MVQPLTISGTTIEAGETKTVCVNVGKLYDYTEMHIHLKVIHSKIKGPTLFISSTIHGDEVNGIDIIKRILRHSAMKKIKGTLILAPIINVFGFNIRSRYFPDRRDLNRSFPGSETGPLAARVAHTFMQEVVKKSTHGIDLHTGSDHRINLPQIRACLDQPTTRKMARAFGAPVIIGSSIKDGSLREAAHELDIPMLVYEAGEALRFDSFAIKSGVRGVLSVMASIGMLNKEDVKKTVGKPTKAFVAKASHWVRAPHGGTIRKQKSLGDMVQNGDLLAVISNPFGDERVAVRSKAKGIVIGHTNLPMVNQGDALFHIATFKDPQIVEDDIDQFGDWRLQGVTI